MRLSKMKIKMQQLHTMVDRTGKHIYVKSEGPSCPSRSRSRLWMQCLKMSVNSSLQTEGQTITWATRLHSALCAPWGRSSINTHYRLVFMPDTQGLADRQRHFKCHMDMTTQWHNHYVVMPCLSLNKLERDVTDSIKKDKKLDQRGF